MSNDNYNVEWSHAVTAMLSPGPSRWEQLGFPSMGAYMCWLDAGADPTDLPKGKTK